MEMEEYKQDTIQFALKQIIWKEHGILQQHKTCDHSGLAYLCRKHNVRLAMHT